MGRKLVDLSGSVFGRLTVVEYVGRRFHSSEWRCVCSCGCEVLALSTALKNGTKLSCGCYRRDRMALLNLTHGERGGAKRAVGSPEYKAWDSMRQRCCNEQDKSWPHYGGRGIKVCDRWSVFENFLADMGRRPGPKHSIDRINSDLGYSPDNCRWTNWTQQARNRSNNRCVTIFGAPMTLVEASSVAGIPYKSVKGRLQKGWTVERALLTPINEAKRDAQRASGVAGKVKR